MRSSVPADHSRLMPPCVEMASWAREGSYTPVFNNRVFTQTFTFFVEWDTERTSPIAANDSSLRDSLAVEIGPALQNALTMWGSSLLLVHRSLDAQLRLYVDTMTQCSTPGSCVYTAPQAVRATCRDNASLLIQLYRTRSRDTTDAVAMAQLRGRTIRLNTAFAFVFRPTLFTIRDDAGRVNLTTVLTHEIGHAIGLAHARTGDNSIMTPVMTELDVSRVATAIDGSALSTVLGHHISGSAPGVFSFTGCEGLFVGNP